MTTNTFELLFVCDQEVKQCLSYREGLSIIEESWRKMATVDGVFNFRSNLLPMGESRLSSHAADNKDDVFGTFLLTTTSIGKRGFSHLSDFFMLWDSKAGLPVFAMCTTTYSRQVKTGCSSALAAKYFAKKDSSKLALIGAGGEAVSHFLAMKEVFNLEEVRVFDISPEALKSFAEGMSKYGISIVPTDGIQEAMRGSDIVVTITTADAPLVKKDWLEEGMTLIKIGSNQELEPEILLEADKVIVDWWDYVRSRSKEIGLLLEQGLTSEKDLDEKRLIYAELPEVTIGRKKGRESDSEKILIIPLTVPSEHLELAAFVYKRAVERGMGVKLNLLSRQGG